MQPIIKALQDYLSKHPELRQKKYNSNHHPLAGHCYIATEALYYLIPSNERSYFKPCCISLGASMTHWFLKDRCSSEVLDPTASQFSEVPDYSRGVGKGFLTKEPSKRTQKVLAFFKEDLIL